MMTLSPFARSAAPRRWLAALAGAAVVQACSQAAPTMPTTPDGQNSRSVPVAPAPAPTTVATGLVISQIYGGGGNAGATLRNDFIEIYNGGTAAVDLSTYSVQYASSAGTSWQVTNLSGSIAPGRHYLIQQAAGTGGSQDLPTPDAIGTIPMSATAGKVALVASRTALTGLPGTPCTPTGQNIVDFVGYGGANCFEGTGPTGVLSNTTAALRNEQVPNGPKLDTGSNAADFQTNVPPNPRNSATAPPSTNPVATVTVTPNPSSVRPGSTRTFTAVGRDSDGNPVATTFTWRSSNTAAATIDAATGIATGVALGMTTITARSANGIEGTAALTVTNGSVTISSRTDPLPAGFQTQLFVNSGSTDNNGAPVTGADVTWTSSNAAIVSVEPTTGVITARAAGSAVITATANSDNITAGSTTIRVNTPAFSSNFTASLNTLFGAPLGAPVGNDVRIDRAQYSLSYNPSRGTPNWVSWYLNSGLRGSAPRCNCFTADTALTRLGFTAWTTNDWINGGVWSRGHMSASADRTVTDGDNAATFFLTNMVPQNQTMNAGVWSDFENFLRTGIDGPNRVFVVSGPIYTRGRTGGQDGFGFMNSLGRIAVPDTLWKVGIFIAGNRNPSEITSADQVKVYAVKMPNEAIATAPWQQYQTTIGEIERSTGLTLFPALPTAVACQIKRNCPVP